MQFNNVYYTNHFHIAIRPQISKMPIGMYPGKRQAVKEDLIRKSKDS